jgi:hypothetical protein
MEWVDGLNLLKLGAVLALLDDEQRRFRVIAYIIGQLLHALHYAHSITGVDGSPLGVVHRDVSPQNVLVSNQGEVKLTDFGVAHHAFEDSAGTQVKGKVRYMAPEQLAGKNRSPTVDLYAVGALLHELLDGRRFRGEHDDGQDLFSVVLSGSVSPLSRPAPPALDHLRRRLLEPEPEQRIHSAEEALELLERYPGYGDARLELTKLCSSLTGVVRPRAGLGHSSAVHAAEPGTARWSSGHAPSRQWPASEIAHPLDAHAPRLPVAPPARQSQSWRTGSTAMTDAPRQWPAVASTEGLASRGRAQTVRSMSRLERSSNAGTPGHAAPSRPRAGSPHELAWTETTPSPRPRTRRLFHAQANTRGEAEAASANRIVEPSWGGETDQDVATRPGEDAVTQRNASSYVPARARPATVLPWRSAAALGLAVGLLAATSVATARWLVGGHDASEASGASAPLQLEAADPPDTMRNEPTRTTRGTMGGPATRSEPPTSTDAGPARGEPTSVAEWHRGLQPKHPPAPWAAVERGWPPSSAAPSNPTDHVRPKDGERRRKGEPAPTVLVKIRGGLGLDRAQVRIASQTITVGDFREVLVTTGRKRLSWRAHERQAWKPGGTWRFEAGTTVMAFVSKDGLKLRTLP